MSFFGKKEETPAPPRTSYTPPPPAPEFKPAPVPEIRKEPAPVSTSPFRPTESDPRSTATVGKAVRIVGAITTKEDLYVDGDVEGTIESPDNKVTIGPNGRVKGKEGGIKARDIVILGQVESDVQAGSKVDIRNGAKLWGNIKTERISIEDGAEFKGSIDIVKNTPKVAPAAVAAPPMQVSSPNPKLPGVEPVISVPPAAPAPLKR